MRPRVWGLSVVIIFGRSYYVDSVTDSHIKGAICLAPGVSRWIKKGWASSERFYLITVGLSALSSLQCFIAVGSKTGGLPPFWEGSWIPI